VRFAFINPEAHSVTVAGSFNDWRPAATPMSDLGHGRWVATLALPPGRYEYQFFVDGRWMQDRAAQELVENPFGGLNSVLVVPPPKRD